MANAVWTPLAESELEEILYYIRIVDGRPEISRRIGEELRDCVERIVTEATATHQHPHAPETWYYIRFKRWLIFYQKLSDGIEVMRVVDASRDLPSALKE
jgi:plasmid stabilization system protein ParE